MTALTREERAAVDALQRTGYAVFSPVGVLLRALDRLTSAGEPDSRAGNAPPDESEACGKGVRPNDVTGAPDSPLGGKDGVRRQEGDSTAPAASEVEGLLARAELSAENIDGWVGSDTIMRSPLSASASSLVMIRADLRDLARALRASEAARKRLQAIIEGEAARCEDIATAMRLRMRISGTVKP